jgi:hypothetical protein
VVARFARERKDATLADLRIAAKAFEESRGGSKWVVGVLSRLSIVRLEAQPQLADAVRATL